jgi:hypothetical protein
VVHHIAPGMLPPGERYPEGHCVWKQVRVAFAACTEPCQWQQGFRSAVEISYHFMKPHRHFAHSGLSHAVLSSLEWFMEISCAMANVPLVCPFGQNPHPDIVPSLEMHRLRLAFFLPLSSMPPRGTTVLDFSLAAARVASQPLESLHSWDMLMETCPVPLLPLECFSRSARWAFCRRPVVLHITATSCSIRRPLGRTSIRIDVLSPLCRHTTFCWFSSARERLPVADPSCSCRRWCIHQSAAA